MVCSRYDRHVTLRPNFPIYIQRCRFSVNKIATNSTRMAIGLMCSSFSRPSHWLFGRRWIRRVPHQAHKIHAHWSGCKRVRWIIIAEMRNRKRIQNISEMPTSHGISLFMVHSNCQTNNERANGVDDEYTVDAQDKQTDSPFLGWNFSFARTLNCMVLYGFLYTSDSDDGNFTSKCGIKNKKFVENSTMAWIDAISRFYSKCWSIVHQYHRNRVCISLFFSYDE